SSAPRRPGLEIVSLVIAGAGSSTSSRPPPSLEGAPELLEDNERVALGYRLPLLDADLLHHAWVLGLHRHLHLHRLADHDRAALFNAVAKIDLDLPHRSCDVRLNDRQATTLLCSWTGASAPARQDNRG